MLSNSATTYEPSVSCDELDPLMPNFPFIKEPAEPPHVELVRSGILAPSPDNNQPWQFVSTADALQIHLDRTQGLPSDVNAMYDLMSVGAVIENIVIAARQRHLQTDVALAPAEDCLTLNGDAPLVATLQFHPSAERDALHAFLASRCTNRKLYSSRAVTGDTLEAVAREVQAFPDVQLDWISDRRTIGTFARLVAHSDRFRFEYEPFHAEIFRQLRFSAAEVEETRDGLDIRTLELPPGGKLLLGTLRSWRRMQWINRLGLGRLLTIPSWLSVRKSGALGVLSIPHPSIQRFVQAGRALQRTWLALDAKGLAMCPLGSLPVFIAHMEQLQGQKLHAAHQRLSVRLNDWFHQLVPQTTGRTLVMLFRTGHATRPTIQSLRRPVE